MASPDPDNIHEHVHEPLLLRLWIYVVLSILILALLVYHALTDHLNITYPSLALLVGTIFGVAITRIYKISWDHNAEKVIYHLDLYGIVLLVLYILFELFRTSIVSYFVHGPSVALTSLALLGGLMIGRVLGIRGKISSILKENL